MLDMSKKVAFGSALFATSFLTACNASTPTDTPTAQAPAETMTVEAPMEAVVTQPTIVELAVSSDDLTTLVAAVTAADLVDTLNSAGPFTVFAPTNAAFDKLPAGTVGTLVQPENKAMLTSILTYHVVGSEVMAADLVKAIGDNGGEYMVPTVNGGTLTASVTDGKVFLTDGMGGQSQVIATDLDASNGVVHLIDTVVMPK